MSTKVKTNSGSRKNVKNKFHIPTKLQCSLSQDVVPPWWKHVIKSIESKDFDSILKILRAIDKSKGILYIPHPFIENIDTFPIKNIRQGMCNFIFFSDSSGNHQWILCQSTSFVDALFSKKCSGKHKYSVDDSIMINPLKSILKKETKSDPRKQKNKKAKLDGYLLDQLRPYHHFYDQLKWLVHLNTKRPIISDYSFFVPSELLKKSETTKNHSNTFSLFPLVIASAEDDSYSKKMERLVYTDSLQNSFSNIIIRKLKNVINLSKRIQNRKRELHLWFGISGQKRIWIEQEDFLPILVHNLEPWFDKFTIYIDGFTRYEDYNFMPVEGSKLNPVLQDIEVFNSIQRKLSNFLNVSIVNLIGQTYRKKIQYCKHVDFFIANAGAGQIVPHRFCRKSGILHSNQKHCIFRTGINNKTVKLVDRILVKDIGNIFDDAKKPSQDVRPGFISYSIEPEVVVSMTKKLLKLK